MKNSKPTGRENKQKEGVRCGRYRLGGGRKGRGGRGLGEGTQGSEGPRGSAKQKRGLVTKGGRLLRV